MGFFNALTRQLIKSSYRKVQGITIKKRWYTAYEQGQSPEPKVREYFYYIDHEGMVILAIIYLTKSNVIDHQLINVIKLFLDDARIKNFTSCFKEKQFLEFFFKRLKRNDTARYTKEFPYLSLCGRERNYIRCDDFPIVFTAIVRDKNGM